jgi:phage shock protein C
MSLSDELGKLGDLHRSGMLSDDEFASAKARVISDSARSATGYDRGARPEPSLAAINALQRSRGDRWIGGVCGGLARMTGLASWIWRLLFAAFALCAGGGVLLYILLWIFVPEEPAPLLGAQGSLT